MYIPPESFILHIFGAVSMQRMEDKKSIGTMLDYPISRIVSLFTFTFHFFNFLKVEVEVDPLIWFDLI